MQQDPMMAQITRAAAALQTGDKAGARIQLEAVWALIADDPQPIHEMALAHTMADAQDDPAQELAWDLRALAAAERCTDEEIRAKTPVQSVNAFRPSLHANLAEDYLKLGDRAQGQRHLELAREHLGMLADDAYGQLVRHGIERIAARLAGP